MKLKSSTTDERLEMLSAECPTHGTVPVNCPRCLGKRGGQRHKGTTWKRKKEFQALEKFGETARRVWDVAPEARMLEAMAEERKRFQKIADKMGWAKEETELVLTDMRLHQGLSHLRELADRMGMSPEQRAKLRKDMQESVALALSSPGEVMASLDRRRPNR